MSTVSPDGARIVAGITRAVVNFGPAAREGDRVQGVLTFFHSLLDEDVLLLEAIDLLPAGTVPGSQRAIAVAGRLASIMYELAMLCSPNVMRHRDAAAASVRMPAAAAAAGPIAAGRQVLTFISGKRPNEKLGTISKSMRPGSRFSDIFASLAAPAIPAAAAAALQPPIIDETTTVQVLHAHLSRALCANPTLLNKFRTILSYQAPAAEPAPAPAAAAPRGRAAAARAPPAAPRVLGAARSAAAGPEAVEAAGPEAVEHAAAAASAAAAVPPEGEALVNLITAEGLLQALDALEQS